MSEVWEARRELHDDPPRTFKLVERATGRVMASVPLCDICGEPLTESQLHRGAKYCSSACRAKGHDRRDPRISNASIEQLEGELLSRLDDRRETYRGIGGVEGPTVRALTRNVRVLKATWMKLRSMTPKASTYMLHLERLVHDAWIKEDTP